MGEELIKVHVGQISNHLGTMEKERQRINSTPAPFATKYSNLEGVSPHTNIPTTKNSHPPAASRPCHLTRFYRPVLCNSLTSSSLTTVLRRSVTLNVRFAINFSPPEEVLPPTNTIITGMPTITP